MRPRETTTHGVIHCAATPNGSNLYGAEEVRKWHVEENGWSAPGYHRIIEVDGSIVKGRDDSLEGAHSKPVNKFSVAACMMGRDQFTREQWAALKWVVLEWFETYPLLVHVLGHCDVEPERKPNCPGFSVGRWLASGMMPLPGHIFGE